MPWSLKYGKRPSRRLCSFSFCCFSFAVQRSPACHVFVLSVALDLLRRAHSNVPLYARSENLSSPFPIQGQRLLASASRHAVDCPLHLRCSAFVLTEPLGSTSFAFSFPPGSFSAPPSCGGLSRPAEVCRRCLERRPCVFTLSTVARRIPRCESPWLFTYCLGSVFPCTSSGALFSATRAAHLSWSDNPPWNVTLSSVGGGCARQTRS